MKRAGCRAGCTIAEKTRRRIGRKKAQQAQKQRGFCAGCAFSRAHFGATIGKSRASLRRFLTTDHPAQRSRNQTKLKRGPPRITRITRIREVFARLIPIRVIRVIRGQKSSKECATFTDNGADGHGKERWLFVSSLSVSGRGITLSQIDSSAFDIPASDLYYGARNR